MSQPNFQPDEFQSSPQTFLAMWCMEGLEFLQNVSAFQRDTTVAILSNAPRPTPPPLEMMKLRARANSQRRYEIYVFNSNVGEEDLRLAFEESPQPLVEWIRRHGEKIYSDRHITPARQMIV